MKLLFLEWTLSSKMGGMELCMFEQCAQLRSLGHDVTIGYNRPGDLLSLYREAGVRPLAMPPYSPRRGHLVRDTFALVASLLRSWPLRLDLIAANSYHSTFFGALLSHLKNVPFVCHLRLNPPTSVSWPTRLGLREVTLFVAESMSVRDLWVARGIDPAAIVVVHDGVDEERFRPLPIEADVRQCLGFSDSDFVIFSGGRIDPVKDLESLLRCFAAVRSKEPRAQLVIAGSPSSFADPAEGEAYLKELKGLARTLGVGPYVNWLGHRSDMPELYAAADVVALFGQVPEPFGRVTCEALACGRPMVTIRQGGSVEILSGEFSKLLFAPGDILDAARIILELVDWKTKDPGFTTRAHEHIRRYFDLASMGERMQRALTTAAQAPRLRNGPRYSCFKESAGRSPLAEPMAQSG